MVGQLDEGASAATRAAVARALAGRPVLGGLGVEIAEIENGRVGLRLGLRAVAPAWLADQAHGGVDRSLVVAIGDAAGWLAVVSGIDRAGHDEMPLVSTLDQKVDLVVTPFEPIELRATGQVIRRGRSLISVKSDVLAIGSDGQMATIGLLQGSYAVG